MLSEMSIINVSLSKISNLLNNEINNIYPKANCSSVKFDLIDFSEFMYDKIGYKLKIIVIFSCLSGTFGYFTIYAISEVLLSSTESFKKFSTLVGLSFPFAECNDG